MDLVMDIVIKHFETKGQGKKGFNVGGFFSQAKNILRTNEWSEKRYFSNVFFFFFTCSNSSV